MSDTDTPLPGFTTPNAKASRMALAATNSPLSTPSSNTPGSKALLQVPPSPCLKKLGYGTGKSSSLSYYVFKV